MSGLQARIQPLGLLCVERLVLQGRSTIGSHEQDRIPLLGSALERSTLQAKSKIDSPAQEKAQIPPSGFEAPEKPSRHARSSDGSTPVYSSSLSTFLFL